jgi:hypothetical protein
MSPDEKIVGALDNRCLVFEAESVEEVYRQLRQRFESQPGNLLLHVLTRIEKPQRIIPEGCEKKDIEESLRYLSRDKPDEPDPDKIRDNFYFNHWRRIKHYPGSNRDINQWEIAAQGIAQQNKHSSISTLIISSPEQDFASQSMLVPPPFFCMAQFTIDAMNRLQITAVYRRQEMSQWWVVNVWELIEYQDRMRKKLADDFETFLLPGPVCMFAITSWWSIRKRIIVEIPKIDEPEGLDVVPLFLAQVFEQGDIHAATRLKEMLEEKARLTAGSNSPFLGLNRLIQTLELMKKWFIEKNSDLFNTLYQETTKAIDLNRKLQDRSLAIYQEDIVGELKANIERLAGIFGAIGKEAK